MFRIYWTECDDANKLDFIDISLALKFTEELRKRQRDGDIINHIVMSCENPDSVGKQGVDVVGPDYNWTKRRIIGTGR